MYAILRLNQVNCFYIENIDRCMVHFLNKSVYVHSTLSRNIQLLYDCCLI